MKFSEKLKEANKVLDWAEEFFKQDVFTEYTNLKLYDISCDFNAEEYVREDILERINYSIWNDMFYQFCDIEFDVLNEYCETEFGEPFRNCVYYVGRTSWFYVIPNEVFETSNSFLETLEQVISCYVFYGYDMGGFLNEENRFDINTIRSYFLENKDCDEAYDLIEIVDYIVDGMKCDVIRDTEDMIKLWNYIDNFKGNQREYFASFLEDKFDTFPEEFLSVCPYCGEPSSKTDIDESVTRCEHCGHFYDGRDLEFKLMADGEEVAIVGIEYDKLINSMFKEPVYKIESFDKPGQRFYALAKEIMIEESSLGGIL